MIAKRGSKFPFGRLAGTERGASAVEFAIIAPLFFMLAFGAVTASLAYQQRSEITAAAREGARYGATLAADTVITGCGSGGACWAAHVRRVVRERAFGNLDDGVAGRKICVALVTGGRNTLALFPNNTFVSDPDGYRPSGQSYCYDDTQNLDVADDPGPRVQVVVERQGQINAVLVQMTPTLSSHVSLLHEER